MNPFVRGVCEAVGKRTDIAPILKDSVALSFSSYAHERRFETNRAMGPKTCKYMFVGLGNNDLSMTRHSVGMQVVDKMAEYLNVSFSKNKNCAGCVGVAKLDNIECVLLKPCMPMNVNGTSVAKTAQLFDVPTQNIYLMHDDIERELGKLSLKEKGSANGHNGVRSVMNSLRTEEITRVKIGINRPPSKDKVGEYVMEEFPPTEQEIVEKVIEKSLSTVAEHLVEKKGEDAAVIVKELKEKLEEKKDQELQ